MIDEVWNEWSGSEIMPLTHANMNQGLSFICAQDQPGPVTIRACLSKEATKVIFVDPKVEVA